MSAGGLAQLLLSETLRERASPARLRAALRCVLQRDHQAAPPPCKPAPPLPVTREGLPASALSCSPLAVGQEGGGRGAGVHSKGLSHQALCPLAAQPAVILAEEPRTSAAK